MKINFTSQEILDKEFKTTIRGYNQDEVDEFLDLVIQDYETFQKEINALKEENKRLKSNSQTNNASTSQRTQTTGQVNYDVLQRLSNLEKAVFGSKYNES
ncbi:cell division regulator GpsB [Aquisalibacillus elongatus]|uniref:DivIVA domain-containing protein n=1 Tax=Aquisalibacillus elongatus TaxID=485577 RepID=A0A3N5BDP5_9BACI|nr:cell division regulator GpsB [Aquisalibacillus elongatus]RPF55806.1 DivIVA domain-containing protein [Aquisalibacillus elongatus]